MKKVFSFVLLAFASTLLAQDFQADAQVKSINATLSKLVINFSHNSASLPEAESTEKMIQGAAQTINQVTSQIPKGFSLNVIGHASNDGSDQYNNDLGMRRAQEVKARLNKAGVADNVLKVRSYGEKENKRAVTFKVLKN